jgi:hypothetical protein
VEWWRRDDGKSQGLIRIFTARHLGSKDQRKNSTRLTILEYIFWYVIALDRKALRHLKIRGEQDRTRRSITSISKHIPSTINIAIFHVLNVLQTQRRAS